MSRETKKNLNIVSGEANSSSITYPQVGIVKGQTSPI
jgi:hypothetical protein